MRNGRLELDSVYGDGPGQSNEASKLELEMRDPLDKAKMRVGVVDPVSTGTAPLIRPVFPVDNGADIPRIGDALDNSSTNDPLTLTDIQAIFGDGVANKTEAEIRRMPLIGDARNDENLIVAQLHLSFLRFHNAVVDKLRADGFATDNDRLFMEARKNVTHIYQWLVVNVYLKTICDPEIFNHVLKSEAQIYTTFYETHKDDFPEGVRPMPIEFSVAAYRFGHSMVRGNYDFNRSFGRDVNGNGDNRATFDQIFQFTGDGGFFSAESERLPDNWIIEWDRFISTGPVDRSARKIDTNIALPLKNMRNAPDGIMKHLALRNLRRGYVFNLPSAQGMIEELNQKHNLKITNLSTAKLKSGNTSSAVELGGFEKNTPLWFYVLKEAEESPGQSLGPLGSLIIAETLVGLLATDHNSYIRQGKFNSWTPSDAVRPVDNAPVDSFFSMFRAGGLLAPHT